MASQIHPASPTTGQIIYTAEFTKTDGSKGEVEPGSFQAELSDPTVANLVVDSDAGTAKVQHNGSFGKVMLKGRGDGNLEPGNENLAIFTFEEEITMVAPLGADAGGFVPGVEGPIS